MIAKTWLRNGLGIIWAAVVCVAAVSPLIERNYELLGVHWTSWTIGAVLLTLGYLLSVRRDQAWVNGLCAAGILLIGADVVATTIAALLFPGPTARRVQPISTILTTTGCGTTAAMVAAIACLLVGIASWLHRKLGRAAQSNSDGDKRS